MELKKLSLLFLGSVALSLNGMELPKEDTLKEEEQNINWSERKHEYLTWPCYRPLGTEEYFEPLKEGIEAEKVKFEPIVHIALDMSVQKGFLAYSGPVDIEGGMAAVIYPSPLWMKAALVLSKKITDLYAASSKDDPSFIALGFEQREKTSLPKGLEINEKYLPRWKTNPEIVLWYNKWQENEEKTLLSQFENVLLNKTEEVSTEVKKSNWSCITH